ncbi:MAG: methyl-accepting chemotaxis protein [Bdellovibrio sp.]
MKRWSLNAKVAFVIGILVVSSLVIAAIGVNKLSQINDSLTQITEVNAARVNYDHKLKELFLIQVINERNFVMETHEEGRKAIVSRMAERAQQIRETVEARKKISNEAGLQTMSDFMTSYENWHQVSDEILRLTTEGNLQEATDISMAKGRSLRLAVEDVIDKAIERNRHIMEDSTLEAKTSYQSARSFMFLVVAVSVLLGISLAFLIMRSVSKAINEVISILTDNSSMVTTASHQIASASEELSQASSEQAASLEETVATLEELTAMVKLGSDNAKEAAKLSEQTQSIAVRGEQEIRHLVTYMENISSDSKKIEEIIGVIDSIAFQTNLLALNAAVEAARAGEQGKGFAVVAEAVRNLAQRSSSAAKDISDLIRGSVEKISMGSHQAGKSGEVLSEIVGAVKKVSDINAEMAGANLEQSNGITQIGKAMNQLDQVTQVNAATSEETAASAQELSAQASQLTQVVEVLVTTIRGGSAKPASTEAADYESKGAQILSMKTRKKESSSQAAVETYGQVGTTAGF